MSDRDLTALERETFRTVTDDGLWDVLAASVLAMFAIAPRLSNTMGDFWSSVVFLPVWIATYLTIQLVREHVVVPRVGTVRFGDERVHRLRRYAHVMLVVNVVAAVLGLIAAISIQWNWFDLNGVAYPFTLGIIVLVVSSFAAHAMSVPRYYLYGLMVAIAPLVGEWLWRNDLAGDHGFPITFGVAAIVIALTGITRFVAVIRSHPLPPTTTAV